MQPSPHRSKRSSRSRTSRGFYRWLESTGGALAFTTYQAGKVFAIGRKPDGRLSIFERSFPRCMGIAVSADSRTLRLATESQIYRFDNVLPEGERQDIHDAFYAPRQIWVTGDLDVHEVAFGNDGPIFINTLFNCIAALSEGFSFRPIWRPPFVTRLAGEDRCHLNGLTLEDGKPRFVSCVSRSDVVDGWRDRRTDGGIFVDVATNEIAAEGLSMPHSPRLKDGKLWLLNSGTGDLGWIDLGAGLITPIAFCPGYARGLGLVGNHAVVGLSKPRENRTFSGLPLDGALAERDVDARCGLLVIDLLTGDTIEWVRIEGVVTELFDVCFLPGVVCPSLIGLKGQEILRVINVDTE